MYLEDGVGLDGSKAGKGNGKKSRKLHCDFNLGAVNGTFD